MTMSRRQEKEDALRRSLLADAARELFHEKTFHGTTVEDIARRAEFGKGTFYKYFAQKEEVALYLAGQEMTGLNGELRALLEASGRGEGFFTLLSRLVPLLLEHHRRNMRLFFVVHNLLCFEGAGDEGICGGVGVSGSSDEAFGSGAVYGSGGGESGAVDGLCRSVNRSGGEGDRVDALSDPGKGDFRERWREKLFKCFREKDALLVQLMDQGVKEGCLRPLDPALLAKGLECLSMGAALPLFMGSAGGGESGSSGEQLLEIFIRGASL